MKRRTTTLLLLALSVLAAGCAAMRQEEIHQKENLLTAAGFKMKLADNPQALAQLQNPSADNSRKGADVLESLGRFLCRFRTWRKILAK